jgi:hypothetical protein
MNTPSTHYILRKPNAKFKVIKKYLNHPAKDRIVEMYTSGKYEVGKLYKTFNNLWFQVLSVEVIK